MTVLVHDYLLVMRGAERSFAAMCDLYPNAPITTLLYDEDLFADRLKGHAVSTSWIQGLAVGQSNFKRLLPLLPHAVGRLPVGGHELVLSSSSAFAHGVRPDPGATHVCYCHTPFRYSWYERDAGMAQSPPYLRPLVGYSLDKIRQWDLEVAQRDTHYIANGLITQRRIRELWGKEASIVYPPVEIHRFQPGKAEDFFLVVGELVRHKQIDTALAAAKMAGVPIKIVGVGVDQHRLQALDGDHAEFLGRVDDAQLASLYARAKALVVPNIEEFGITAVEAQASGRPVIAADGGGVRESVVDGETGMFFPAGDTVALARAMRSPLLETMSPRRAVENAQQFSVDAFQQGIIAQIKEAQRT